MICADRRWPETTRTLALKGALIIFNPTYGMCCDLNLAMMRTRAYESEVYIVFTHPQQALITGPEGEIITNINSKSKSYVITEIELEKVKHIRKQQAESGKAMVEHAEQSIFSNRAPKHIDDLNEWKLYEFGSNATRLLLDRTETDRFETVVVSWPKGNKGAIVAHKEKEQTFFVLSGSGIVTVNDEHASVKPGDIIFVPRNVPHTTEATGEDLSYLCLNAYIGEMQDESFEEMYRRIAPQRIERWKSGDGSVGE